MFSIIMNFSRVSVLEINKLYLNVWNKLLLSKEQDDKYSTFMTRLYLGDGDSEIYFKQRAGEVQDIDKIRLGHKLIHYIISSIIGKKCLHLVFVMFKFTKHLFLPMNFY